MAQEQDFKNHSRIVPQFHYLTFGIILLVLVGSILKFYRNYSTGLGGLLSPSILILISVALILLAWYSRVFALKAQDRAIRAEENLRYFILTGKLPDRKLSIRQLIALRFAADDDLQELAQKAAAENLNEKEIKRQIKRWKADHYRV